jgi:excinuclease ABC subunit A
MTKPVERPAIRLRGVRHNNLKNFDLDVPLGQLTVVTGLSGSGKSSLAFDTLFAEGQRRYIETFSPYARQFFDRMDKPQVDRIEGIPPAIAIEQRNSVRSTRSTVGTMTELCDYMKLLWPHLARLHCRQCGRLVRKEPPQVVWETMIADRGLRIADLPESGRELLITFDLPLSEKLSLAESLALVTRQGYQRLLLDGEVIRVEELESRRGRRKLPALTLVQDRVRVAPTHRARFVEACEQAYHFGKGKIAVYRLEGAGANPQSAIANPQFFSAGFHCARCDLDYREPTPALFSFNHPIGACPACKGFGRIISIDYSLAIPDRSKTLAEGCVKPWQSGMSAECQADLMKFCRASDIRTDVPFQKLSQRTQDWVIHGDADYDPNDPEHSWPRAWYGVKGYFRWLESKTYKMHVRVLLSRYRAYSTCPECAGKRFNKDSLLYALMLDSQSRGEREKGRKGDEDGHSGEGVPLSPLPPFSLSLADFYALPIDAALDLIERTAAARKFAANDPIQLALNEVRSRLRYLVEVGLGYLTLDRPTRTLSGGETERVNLTTCLGTRLVNTLFVLDEPSVGLHPRDTGRLVHILEQLRDAGNTVVVVEHEASVIRAADRIVDLGPGQGEKGGEVIFNGPVKELLNSERSLTGQYLSGRKQVEILRRRPVAGPFSFMGAASGAEEKGRKGEREMMLQEAPHPFPPAPFPPFKDWLRVKHATRNNLKDLNVEIPLGRFVCLAGVSGSGKTTLVREVLLPALQARLQPSISIPVKASDRLETEADDSSDALATSNEPSATLEGWESLSHVVLVDQSPLGRTPRSNPVVYIGAFDDVRELFAQTDLAKQRGLNASAFSFNSGVGQCERCRGAGFEKIEMQFLSDVFIRCPECNGRRYRQHILEVKLRGAKARKVISESVISNQSAGVTRRRRQNAGPLNTDSLITDHWSIADLLEATVDDTLEFLWNFINLPAGRRALGRLRLLQEVGLGYLRLGQPINTLSGGESQRLKLVSHLADVVSHSNGPVQGSEGVRERGGEVSGAGSFAHSLTPPLPHSPRTLFLFDEPTTGLHFDDVRVLLKVFQRLVDAGHSVLVIEHNLDVIKCADWVIDLGPDAGERGGRLVAAGTPEHVAERESSHTGRFLREVLRPREAATFAPATRSD